ncbi:MAG: site-specific integrase [Agriterribacter sp.]
MILVNACLQGFFIIGSSFLFRFFPLFSAFFGEQLANSLANTNLFVMGITITTKTSRNGLKKWYYFEWGKAADQRKAAGMFTWITPRNQVEKNYNKEIRSLLDTKLAELILEKQAVGSGFIPAHKFKTNFLDYYEEYVKNNIRKGKRHLEQSLKQFRTFIGKEFISPSDITENLCVRFRQHLLDHFNGDTPSNYFSPFKKMIKSATKEGYFKNNPVDEVAAKGNKNKKLKEHFESNEYIQLLNTPCYHEEVRDAFILSCYAGLRWCDVKPLDWSDIKGDQLKTRIVQAKTGEPLSVTLHPIARTILEKRRARLPKDVKMGKVFGLPSAEGANKILHQWCGDARIDKHITWHCARLSFSILLQDANVDNATVALLLGHTSTKYVDQTYKRHRPKDQSSAIERLPDVQLKPDRVESLRVVHMKIG